MVTVKPEGIWGWVLKVHAIAPIADMKQVIREELLVMK
jgi:hypothetical protein